MAGWRSSDATRSGDEDASVLTGPDELRRVRAVLTLGGVPWSELEDGVQQVRLKWLEQQADPTREQVRDPGAWLSVVASRVAVDWHRARAREQGLRQRLSARWSHTPPVDHPEQDRVLALAVAEGLELLSGVQRQVLLLRFYADLPVAEIAAVLGVAEGTVKSRLHDAVTALGARLRERKVI